MPFGHEIYPIKSDGNNNLKHNSVRSTSMTRGHGIQGSSSAIVSQSYIAFQAHLHSTTSQPELARVCIDKDHLKCWIILNKEFPVCQDLQ